MRGFVIVLVVVLAAIGIGVGLSNGLPEPSADSPGSYCPAPPGRIYGPAAGRFALTFSPGRISEHDDVALCEYGVTRDGTVFLAEVADAALLPHRFGEAEVSLGPGRQFRVDGERGDLLSNCRGSYDCHAVLIISNGRVLWTVSVYGAGAPRAEVFAFIKSFRPV